VRGSQSRCRRPRPSSTNAGPWTPDAGVDLQHRIIDACVQRAEDGGQLKRMLLLLLLQTNVLPRARARRRANAMAEDELDSHTHTPARGISGCRNRNRSPASIGPASTAPLPW